MPRTESTHSPWIRQFHTTERAGVHLACFPQPGESATFYRPMSRELESSLEVLVAQYPLQSKEPAETSFSDINCLADELSYAVACHIRQRPVALFGHGFGALLAYQVTRRLQANGSHVLQLFVSGQGAPDFIPPNHIQPAMPHEDQQALPKALDCPITAVIGDTDPTHTLQDSAAWAAHTTGPFDLWLISGGHFYLKTHLAEVVNLISDALLPHIQQYSQYPLPEEL